VTRWCLNIPLLLFIKRNKARSSSEKGITADPDNVPKERVNQVSGTVLRAGNSPPNIQPGRETAMERGQAAA
jgi:hypothetical protein